MGETNTLTESQKKMLNAELSYTIRQNQFLCDCLTEPPVDDNI